MNNILNRRAFMAALAGFVASIAFAPNAAFAFSVEKARALIEKVLADIQVIINSSKPEAQMLKDFERIFDNYGDVTMIGQLVLGPDGRAASSSQRRAFAQAFKGYISRKYGRRFREFAGAEVTITRAKAVKSFYEITTRTKLQGRSPLVVTYVVSNRSGRFIDIKIEGISLIKSERSEIGAMLDARGGDLNRLIADLKSM